MIVESSEDSSLHAPEISMVSWGKNLELNMLYHFKVLSSALNSARLI